MKIQCTTRNREKWIADVQQTFSRVVGNLYYGKSLEKSFNVKNCGDYFIIVVGSSGAQLRFPLKENK